MATAARSIPTAELGAEQQGTTFTVPLLDDHEVQAETQWPVSVTETYPAMLNDPQVEGMYRSVMLSIRAQDAWLDPNGARPETTARISESYNLPIGPDGKVNQARGKRRFIFDEHLEDALRAPGYGHYFFEPVYDIDVGPGDVLTARLRKLAPRPPRSILAIQPARDGGLEHIEVPAANPQGPAGWSVKIPVNRLVAYVWDREGANWVGRSMLRSLYQPWKLKARVIRAGVYAIERAGGTPMAQAPEHATPAERDEILAALKAMRVGNESAAVFSHGTQLQFANSGGGTQAVEYVRLQNEEMARAWVQMLMILGQSESGSRALGETFAERADLVEMAIKNWLCRVFTRHVIEDDVDLNEGPDEKLAPVLRFTPRGGAVDALAGAMDDAQVAGALPADSSAAATVKAAAGERQRSRRVPRVAATATDPVDVSGTDFKALQDSFETALAALAAGWDGQRAALIDDLVAQVEAAESPAELAAVAAEVEDTAWLTETLHGVTEHGASAVVDEAKTQGHTLPAAGLDTAHAAIADAADGTGALLARSLSMSAATKAVQLATLLAGDRAAQVREHLEGLKGADAEYELSGLVTKAQNAGRFAQMAEAPDGTRYYASELNDTNTCAACADIDGTEFESLDDAQGNYPAGFALCEGGDRCRGTAVAVYPEASPS